ncbi:MAG: response regulator [Marinilabiliaceae bacterium]|nr:response regulator [Marinilabiliaceae bacterium]
MKKVLIVDDAADSRLLFKKLLEKYPVEILEAKDGKEAWDIILKEQPHLVLLDIHMPNKDGFELLEDLKEEWISIPVAVVSNDDEAITIESSFYLGAQAFLKKPIDLKEFKDVIRVLNLPEQNTSYWG